LALAASLMVGHPVLMDDSKPDAWEEAALIVEAYAGGADAMTVALLARIAKAIRERATDE
jgi:hypothetical protein